MPSIQNVPTGWVQPYTTGPTYVWLGVGAAGTAAFFGTAEGYPRHERRPEYEQLMNDVGGRRKPVDMSWQGMDATLSLVMTVWDEGIAQILENLPRFELSSFSTPPGSWAFSDMGALMAFEGNAMQIWLAYNFAAKTAYGPLPLGYHYLKAVPVNLTDENGAQPMKRIFSFYIWPETDYNDGIQTLFDYNVKNLPTPFSGGQPATL